MRKRLFRENAKFFHINLDFLCHPIFKELDWIFIQKQIEPLLLHYDLHLYALVMMDTHIHLLVQSDMDCHCEPILNYPQFLNAYKYIYRNPVEAGIVDKVEDYPYSTLKALIGKSISYCSVTDHMGLVQNPFHHLNWLNNKDLFKFSQLRQFSSDSMLT